MVAILRELRPNEPARLEADLESTMREMIESDPEALTRILSTLNRVLEPTFDTVSTMN